MLATLSGGSVLVAAGLVILTLLRRPALGGLALGLGLLAMAAFLGARASMVGRKAASARLLAPLYVVAMGLGAILGLLTLATSAVVLTTGQADSSILRLVDVLPYGGILLIGIVVVSVLIDPYELSGD